MTALRFLEGDKICKIGSKYAKVFPVPVGAVTIMFLF